MLLLLMSKLGARQTNAAFKSRLTRAFYLSINVADVNISLEGGKQR